MEQHKPLDIVKAASGEGNSLDDGTQEHQVGIKYICSGPGVCESVHEYCVLCATEYIDTTCIYVKYARLYLWHHGEDTHGAGGSVALQL